MPKIFTAEEIIGGIDFPQLKGQKQSLLGTIDSLEREGKTKEAEDLTGILNLLDSIQDHAVDVMGKDKNDVFSFESDREDLIDKMQQLVTKAIEDDIAEISKHDSSMSLRPDEDFQFNLGTHYNGYVQEVGNEYLMSNEGNHYSYETLEMEQLCQLFDHLKEKYEI